MFQLLPIIPQLLQPPAPHVLRRLFAAMALDARTGALRWHKQMVPNDSHDWDLTQATIGGDDVKLVATVCPAPSPSVLSLLLISLG